ncbi:MAG: translation initiation factor eIF-1A [Candidatus Helarchaeota archaeon]
MSFNLGSVIIPKKKAGKKKNRGGAGHNAPTTIQRRVTVPNENQVLGIVIQLLGAGWLKVQCMDEKIRNCRIRGKIRKRMWIRIDDWVLVEPWAEMQSDERGDIILRYTKSQARWLQRNGYISEENVIID